MKALLVQGIAAEEGKAAPVVALFLRGDHELNEIKAEKHPKLLRLWLLLLKLNLLN